MVGTNHDIIARAERRRRRANAVDEGPIGRLVVDENVILAPPLNAKMDAAELVALQDKVASRLASEPGFFKGQPDCLASLAAFGEDEFEHGNNSLKNTAR